MTYSAPTTVPAAPVVTYKKVYSKYFGEKLNRVSVDGVAKYDIFRRAVGGFECFTLEANDTHGHFVCGGADVLLREVKEVLEGMVLRAYNELLNTPGTGVHEAAVERNFQTMADAQCAIQSIEDERDVVSYNGEELPVLLNSTISAIHNSGMSSCKAADQLAELVNAANMVFEAQQALKEATEALQAIRTRVTIFGKLGKR